MTGVGWSGSRASSPMWWWMGALAWAWVCACAHGGSATSPPEAPATATEQAAAPTSTEPEPEPDEATQAIERYKAKLAESPNLYPVWAQLGEAYLRRARSMGDVADYDRAAEALDRSLSIQLNQEALRWMSAVRLDQHRFPEAVDLARQALEAFEGDGIARTVLVDALVAMGRYDEARAAVEATANAEQDFYSIAGYSRLLFLTGDAEGAISRLRRALELLEEQASGMGDAYEHARAWCHLMIGSYLFETGRPQEAVVEYDKALAIQPGAPDIVEHRAEWEALYGDKTKAVQMYEQLLERHPRTHEMIALGELLVDLEREEEGRRWLDRAEKQMRERLEAGDISVRRDLAMFLLDQGRDKGFALELARADLETRQDPLAYDALAWALYHNGERDKAREAMRKALEHGTPLQELEEHRRVIQGQEGAHSSEQ